VDILGFELFQTLPVSQELLELAFDSLIPRPPTSYPQNPSRPGDQSPPIQSPTQGTCGQADVTDIFNEIMRDVRKVWKSIPSNIKSGICCQIGSRLDLLRNGNFWGYVSWDINVFAGIATGEGSWPFPAEKGNPSPPCDGTVVLNGECYYANAMNYALWGSFYKLCATYTGNFQRYSEEKAINGAVGWKSLVGSMIVDDTSEFVKYGYDLRGYTPKAFRCKGCVVTSPVSVNIPSWYKRWGFGNGPTYRIEGEP